jgi:hypothetical protein
MTRREAMAVKRAARIEHATDVAGWGSTYNPVRDSTWEQLQRSAQVDRTPVSDATRRLARYARMPK